MDGGRPSLGQLFNVPATIEMGGNNVGQVIQNVKVFEPRGWSALHVMEGGVAVGQAGCSGVQILNNQIGPAGFSPSPTGSQFRKRQAGHVPGEEKFRAVSDCLARHPRCASKHVLLIAVSSTESTT